MFLVSFALKFLMLFLYQEQFGIRFSKKEKTFLVCYYAGIFLVHYLTPYDFYNRYLGILIPAASFLLEGYTFCKVFFGKPVLQPYAMLVFWGTVTAVAGMAVDSYYANGNIYPDVSLVFPFCIAVYMMLLSVAFILRMLKLHREYEQSAARLEMARSQIAMQTEYYDALSGQINEVRALRHDVRHFASTLALLADEGRFVELRRFVAEYAELAEMEPLPVYCDNAVVNSVLGYYALRLKEKNIPFHCVCAIPKTLSVQDSDLCIVLSNSLENAMEACLKVPTEKNPFVAAEARLFGGRFLIKVVNSYDGQLSKSGSTLATSKEGSGHGFGLKNTKRVVESYDGYLKTEYDGNTFTLMAAFPAEGGAGVTHLPQAGVTK